MIPKNCEITPASWNDISDIQHLFHLYFLVNWFPKGKPEIIQSLDFGIEP